MTESKLTSKSEYSIKFNETLKNRYNMLSIDMEWMEKRAYYMDPDELYKKHFKRVKRCAINDNNKAMRTMMRWNEDNKLEKTKWIKLYCMESGHRCPPLYCGETHRWETSRTDYKKILRIMYGQVSNLHFDIKTTPIKYFGIFHDSYVKNKASIKNKASKKNSAYKKNKASIKNEEYKKKIEYIIKMGQQVYTLINEIEPCDDIVSIITDYIYD